MLQYPFPSVFKWIILVYAPAKPVLLIGCLLLFPFSSQVDGRDTPPSEVWVPPGSLLRGDTLGDGESDGRELPVGTVEIHGFWMATTLVTWSEWRIIRTWALRQGYSFSETGGGKADDHPVHSISWHDAAKWCNAKSERAGRRPVYYVDTDHTEVFRNGRIDLGPDQVDWEADGYRLPTEAEWEWAARGGLAGKRFPWGDEMSHEQANYYSLSFLSYDTSHTRGHHPRYGFGGWIFTSPVRSFPPNGYGLHDMAGNLWEWCWDWYRTDAYSLDESIHPKGPLDPGPRPERVLRGGSWLHYANQARVSARWSAPPREQNSERGFRTVRHAPDQDPNPEGISLASTPGQVLEIRFYFSANHSGIP